ncbi:MAG: DUF3168 domain-containing protein [Mesorhizobium sp.]|uniref:DUF3168 domain-containing protein n=1 Tax=Mesorhizobium sp. TaxID=1871066 RepID=UPI000FE907FC|nr:DUF3168 domain-containing protein [Mesorhizobium sp.]RWD50568.1 MAG: DUF3168 domain-containing protein [Mesorhizobium sp.]RWE55782.1 MAG: DUF3168 domain-containing protein [Mesorhizobium sp.]RWF07317.1 MAG: DUF3168 domain-containing protein [Mesorhizobium sp.]RWF09687.1 MAG: DUF3168 domain-containing protein [Mesorhizobium sp.]TIX74516.1 MAG: DUF3168 domain-containing protein [Mesorhizobium sp.]
MMEPTVALQTAIRSRLLDRPAVTALVLPDHIRAGSTRPDKTPAIIMSDGTTALHGYDYTAQRAAWVNLDIHIWTLDQGQEAAKAIAFAVCNALDSKWKLQIDGGYCDHLEVTRAVYPRDPDPLVGHGVLSVEALIRWIV